jgi:thioester reductase-like protein
MAGQTVQRDGALLLTGGTGFVGMEILARYLERTDRPIYALVRAPSEAEAGARIRSVISSLFGRADAYRGRVVAIPADIESPELGLDRARRGSLAERVTDIIHAAASVSFSLPLDESRQINVEGTRRLLELAELCASRGGLARFSYISTAYVAGTHTGDFAEDQFEVGQGFRNSYELSKFEAERLVRSYGDRIPVQIFRPSIVVGERPSGWTASFNVLYSPLKAFARGAYPAIPARRSTPVDVVPVDYVADAVFELSTGPVGDAETYHLVSGREATTVGRLIDLAAARFDRRKPLVIPPRLYGRLLYPLLVRRSTGRRRHALERTKVFFPYFSMRVSYDDRRARSRLEAAGIRVSPLERYFDRLVEFAVRARWGRRALGRAEARRTGVARPRC